MAGEGSGVVREEDDEFWLAASRRSLDAHWGDAADDVYAELLEDGGG